MTKFIEVEVFNLKDVHNLDDENFSSWLELLNVDDIVKVQEEGEGYVTIQLRQENSNILWVKDSMANLQEQLK